MHLLPKGTGRQGASCRANLRLLSEEDLGLAATGNLRRDLWRKRHLDGTKVGKEKRDTQKEDNSDAHDYRKRTASDTSPPPHPRPELHQPWAFFLLGVKKKVRPNTRRRVL